MYMYIYIYTYREFRIFHVFGPDNEFWDIFFISESGVKKPKVAFLGKKSCHSNMPYIHICMYMYV